jgi:hypothetical protein
VIQLSQRCYQLQTREDVLTGADTEQTVCPRADLNRLPMSSVGARKRG